MPILKLKRDVCPRTPKRYKKLKPIEYKIIENNCWICTSHKYNKATNILALKSGDKKVTATRLIFEQYHNETLTSMDFVLHTCGNASCINPEHLIKKTGLSEATHYKVCLHNNSNSNRKLTKEQVEDIRKTIIKRTTVTTLAKKYKVSRRVIYGIIQNKNYIKEE